MKQVHHLSNYINVIASFIARVQLDIKHQGIRGSELPPVHTIPWEKFQEHLKKTPFPKLTDMYNGSTFDSTYTNAGRQINELIDVLNTCKNADEFKTSINKIQKIIQGESCREQNMFFLGERYNVLTARREVTAA